MVTHDRIVIQPGSYSRCAKHVTIPDLGRNSALVKVLLTSQARSMINDIFTVFCRRLRCPRMRLLHQVTIRLVKNTNTCLARHFGIPANLQPSFRLHPLGSVQHVLCLGQSCLPSTRTLLSALYQDRVHNWRQNTEYARQSLSSDLIRDRA